MHKTSAPRQTSYSPGTTKLPGKDQSEFALAGTRVAAWKTHSRTHVYVWADCFPIWSSNEDEELEEQKCRARELRAEDEKYEQRRNSEKAQREPYMPVMGNV